MSEIMELGLHFSNRTVGAIIVSDTAGILSRTLPVTREICENLPRVVSNQITSMGGTLKQLTRIGVVVGPGALTPLRISVAFSNTLAAVLNIQVVGVSAFDVHLIDGWESTQLVILEGRGKNMLLKGFLRNGFRTTVLFAELEVNAAHLERILSRFRVPVGVIFASKVNMDQMLQRIPDLDCRLSEAAPSGIFRVMAEQISLSHGASVSYSYPAV